MAKNPNEVYTQEEKEAMAEKLQDVIALDLDPEKFINEVFSYHALEGDQPQRYIEISSAAKVMAERIFAAVPHCEDRRTALLKLRECVMFANAGIALKGAI